MKRTLWDEIRIQKILFLEKLNVFGRDFRRDVYSSIGNFFCERYRNFHSDNDLREVERTINMIMIKRVWYSHGYLWIESSRPGLIIGKRGEQIDALSKYISSHWRYFLPFKGIKLKEEKELSWLHNYRFGFADWDG